MKTQESCVGTSLQSLVLPNQPNSSQQEPSPLKSGVTSLLPYAHIIHLKAREGYVLFFLVMSFICRQLMQPLILVE